MISLGGMSTVLPAPDGSFNGDDKWRFLGLHDTDTDPSVVLTTFP